MNRQDPLEAALRAPAPEAAAAARRFANRAAAQRSADLYYAHLDSPLGDLLAVAGSRGLVVLHYDFGDADATLERLAARRSPRIVESSAALERWRRELDEYFEGRRREFEAPVD